MSEIATIITIMKLKKLYGPHAVPVLMSRGYLKEMPRKRGAIRKYTTLKLLLPTHEDFTKMFREDYTYTLACLVEDAFNEFTDLGSELGEWYDNMPESFQQSDKGSMLEEGRSTLENMSAPDVPALLGDINIFCPPMLRCSSRADRRDYANQRLQVVIEELENIANGEFSDELKLAADKEETDLSEEAEMLRDELQNALDEAESVEFPGMY